MCRLFTNIGLIPLDLKISGPDTPGGVLCRMTIPHHLVYTTLHYYTLHSSYLLVTSDRYIPVKNILRWSAVVCCACEIIQLLSVVFCVVTAVHDWLGACYKGSRNASLWYKLLFFLQEPNVSPRTSLLRGLYPCCAGQLHSLKCVCVSITCVHRSVTGCSGFGLPLCCCVPLLQ
jgi:hypothetical protein